MHVANVVCGNTRRDYALPAVRDAPEGLRCEIAEIVTVDWMGVGLFFVFFSIRRPRV